MKDIKLLNGDLSIRNGLIATCEKSEKLQQQLLKILITRLNGEGSYLHPQYGSEIMNIMGKPYTTLVPELRATIRQAMDRFIDNQALGITFDVYDPEEILYKVNYVNVRVISGDSRGANVVIGVIDGTLKDVEIDQNFFT